MTPSVVKVACHDIKIERITTKRASSDQVYGRFRGQELSIEVEDGLAPTKEVDTVLHEINHAIYWIYGMDDQDKEERIVSTFATAWTQIYRDNPALLKYVESALHGEASNAKEA